MKKKEHSFSANLQRMTDFAVGIGNEGNEIAVMVFASLSGLGRVASLARACFFLVYEPST